MLTPIELEYGKLIDALRNVGYCKIAIEDLDSLTKLKERITNLVAQQLRSDTGKTVDPSFTLESLHKHYDPANINQFRLNLIKQLSNSKLNFQLLVDPLPKLISTLLGRDLLIQKGVNLVIQRPKDQDNSELHRDFPSNSGFEIVVWLPFVDCTEAMSMYLVNRSESRLIAKALKDSDGCYWQTVKDRIESDPPFVEVKFGESLIFLTPLFHGSKVHNEESTRFSFNFRMKPLFAPSGLKDPYSFWEIYSTSEFTELILDYYEK